MTLTLYFHPLSSYSWKALMALYENDTPFQSVIVDQDTYADFKAMWPIAKFPVLRDAARDWLIPESSIIIEYLDQHARGPVRFIPDDPDLARQMRLRDRFFDLYLHNQMQRIVANRLRPPETKDATNVAEARAGIATACALAEQNMASAQWAMGDVFTMADCAAAPALYYIDKVAPLTEFPHLRAYLDRLKARPSFARVLDEAGPYLHMFPQD